MNPLIQLKKATPVFLVALACLGFLPATQAVSPTPDGCYPGLTTAEGCNALNFLTTGVGNTGVGWYALFANSSGNYNTAIGAGALDLNNGDSNTAVGAGALLLNTAGIGNTATGAVALLENTSGGNNTANGDNALNSNTAGNGNTAIGVSALPNNTVGNLNTALGAGAGGSVLTASNVICIGAAGQNVSNTFYIGNIFNTTSSGGIAVFINSDGQLGTTTSSRRFKDEIKPMDKASEALFALKPVTFCYKKEIDPAGTSQFGLVAEDVEKVNPDLVVRDEKGKPYSVRYDQVNSMLLNEFLKEHREVQELKKQIEALSAGLQKVSAQLEASKRAPQVVSNP